MFNPKIVKEDFPIFYHNPGLVYLDSTATSLKPISVIKKLDEYYKKYSANIHRGIYHIAEKATEEYEETRKIVALFMHVANPEEIIFTRNATESINLVASTLGEEIVEQGDEIVTTVLEHHSNFVPWQQLAFRTGADLKVIAINEDFQLPIEHNGAIDVTDIITKKTKLLSLTYVSNTLGTILPVKKIIQAAKKINPHIITIVDGAQAAPHIKINIPDLGCDFFAFSSHKMLGPTGIGILWGRKEILEKMSPYQLGGSMISEVTIDKTTFAEVPQKFEAGTPNIGGAIAFKAAIQYLEYLGMENIQKHEKKLTKYAIHSLQEAFAGDITIYGPKNVNHRAGIISFSLSSIHPHDIAQILDEDSIAIRAGHHCAQPLHAVLKVPATVRVSLYVYNDESDIDKLIQSLKKVVKLLKK